ncbi:PGAP1-like protein [Amycolatopsis vancoresmycina DSM 44592]|uniref:PGAP1-like protein n=1 Tax=Amycolatopsis vancoresmycina DSM 44592 TaxID=1292037 RepID=R1GH66_9PSEU|nr:PGAP1-like protein [Amycolatopsis vancoresmycina DSM 44592]
MVLVPGFFGGATSLTVTRRRLPRRGFRPCDAGIGLDAGCTSDLVDRLERRVARHVADTGGRVVLIGHSRGGGLARLAATRRPDLVRGLIARLTDPQPARRPGSDGGTLAVESTAPRPSAVATAANRGHAVVRARSCSRRTRDRPEWPRPSTEPATRAGQGDADCREAPSG